MIMDEGYLYRGLVYYGKKPSLSENGEPIWPRPLKRKTEPSNLPGEGPVKFLLHIHHVEIILEFSSIR